MSSNRHTIHTGDVTTILPTLDAESFDAMLTDPPYGLEFMGKDWDKVVPGPEVWQHTLTALKPGAYALIFGGTRTFHRLAVALEDAGFEIKDPLMWLYGSGFPKNHDISKNIDKAAGATRQIIAPNPHSSPGRSPGVLHMAGDNHRPNLEARMREAGIDKPPITAPATPEAEHWTGYGTALKPAWEPIILARKPTPLTYAQNALTHHTGALNIDGTRIPGAKDTPTSPRRAGPNATYGDLSNADGTTTGYDPNAGRWPANVITDGSDEVLDLFPHTESGSEPQGGFRRLARDTNNKGIYGGGKGLWHGEQPAGSLYGDSGNAARFYYTAKATRNEREAGLGHHQKRPGGMVSETSGQHITRREAGYERPRVANHHPTVKPLALTRYLATLLLPPPHDAPRRLLTPYSGAGSELIGALQAGWDHVTGIELDPEYVTIAEDRLYQWLGPLTLNM